jgi:2-polyprenyl-3-methyl-5-hydroxy-6-metoxy-1,4-benzoquinol methylase
VVKSAITHLSRLCLREESAVSSGAEIEAMRAARLESWGRINRSRLNAVLAHAGQSILDVGCSTGAYVAHLGTLGYWAYGLDLVLDKSWRQGVNRSYVNGIAAHLPFADGAFDTVTAFEVLEHVHQPGQVLAEFRRVCRENMILTVPDCEPLRDMLRAGMVYAHWRDPTHRNQFTKQSLASTLAQAGFQVELLTRMNPILPDFLVLRSFHVPYQLAYFASRVLRRFPLRTQYRMTLLAVACRL